MGVCTDARTEVAKNSDVAALSFYDAAMATMWWKNLTDFERDLTSADEKKVRAMFSWARLKENSAAAPGMGRNPKARRHYRLMRVAAQEELARRGHIEP